MKRSIAIADGRFSQPPKLSATAAALLLAGVGNSQPRFFSTKQEYPQMKPRELRAVVSALAVAAFVLPMTALAASDSDESESRIQRGFAIAPVPLNLAKKNRAQVGLGSYLVNAVGGCNDCHTNPSYAPGGDPFLGQPKQVNAAAYMGGGRPFGPVIVSRNLTPDKTGRPEGGATFEEFLSIMRTGVDPDHAPPRLLQVMPWPVYQDMSDGDLRAIYEYLSAIPCVEGDPGLPSPRPPGTRCH